MFDETIYIYTVGCQYQVLSYRGKTGRGSAVFHPQGLIWPNGEKRKRWTRRPREVISSCPHVNKSHGDALALFVCAVWNEQENMFWVGLGVNMLTTYLKRNYYGRHIETNMNYRTWTLLKLHKNHHPFPFKFLFTLLYIIYSMRNTWCTGDSSKFSFSQHTPTDRKILGFRRIFTASSYRTSLIWFIVVQNWANTPS